MKTIRLLYPDYVSGGLDTYYFGANLLSHILPENDKQPLIKVEITPPDGTVKQIKDGIYAKDEVLAGIKDAMAKIEAEDPDKIITIGGNCMVSLAPFDYLHGKYKNAGIIWIDAHPDVSTAENGYPNAHAMVLGAVMGYGDRAFSDMMKNERFKPSDVLYVGLQGLHDYQKKFLDDTGVNYKVQTDAFVSEEDIRAFAKRFDCVLVIWTLTYWTSACSIQLILPIRIWSETVPGAVKMTMEKLAEILCCITNNFETVGFTIAEYLPFDEQKLNKMFAGLDIFTK